MPPRRETLKTCALVLLLTAGATGLRCLFSPVFGVRAPLLFHVLAIAIAAEVAGTLAGLFTAALSVVAVAYFTVFPGSGALPGDHIAILVFAFVGIALSWFCGWRKRRQDELLRLQQNFETAQQLANIGSWESDLVGTLWWSPTTYRIFGIDPGTRLETRDFYDLVHPEDRVTVRQAVPAAVESGADIDVRYRIIRTRDREVRWVHQRARIIRGSSVRLVGSVRDITAGQPGDTGPCPCCGR